MGTLVVACGAKTADELTKEWESRAELKGQYSVQRLDNADVLGPGQGGAAMTSLGQGVTVLIVTASGAVVDALRGSAVNKAPGITRDFIVPDAQDQDIIAQNQPDKAPGITRDFVAEE